MICIAIFINFTYYRFFDMFFIFIVYFKKKSFYGIKEIWLRVCDANKTVWKRLNL